MIDIRPRQATQVIHNIFVDNCVPGLVAIAKNVLVCITTTAIVTMTSGAVDDVTALTRNNPGVQVVGYFLHLIKAEPVQERHLRYTVREFHITGASRIVAKDRGLYRAHPGTGDTP